MTDKGNTIWHRQLRCGTIKVVAKVGRHNNSIYAPRFFFMETKTRKNADYSPYFLFEYIVRSLGTQ